MINLKNAVATIIPSLRISLALSMLTTCVLLSALMLGFTPDEDKFILESRKNVSESIAIQLSLMSSKDDIKKIGRLIHYVVKRNDEILSAGIRLTSGELVFQSNNHSKIWGGNNNDSSSSSHVLVPLLHSDKLWGKVELRFVSLKNDSFMGFLSKPIFKMIVFIMIIGFFVYFVFMIKILQHLDPSAIIPKRVNAAFDTLSEGVIIIDENEHILLTNSAFSNRVGLSSKSLLGKKASNLDWELVSNKESEGVLPWANVLNSGIALPSIQLNLKSDEGKVIKFIANTSPIEGGDDKPQGVLVTLDDITDLEERNTELQSIVVGLEASQEEIQQKNKELHYLATRDPMTGCLNRRSFNEQFKVIFDASVKHGSELCCIMVDLDHFKLVNDNYGHAKGDVVIKLLAEILKSNTRDTDLVGRYGGEEFCVVLNGLSIDDATITAERIRLRVKDESTKRFEGGPRVTASLGIASIFDNPKDPDAFVNIADEALYVAKESGRNCVVRWEPAASDKVNNEVKSEETTPVLQDKPKEYGQTLELQERIDELENIATHISAELEFSKSYDPLTELPNQTLFYDRILQSLERGYRNNQVSAVVVLDIDNFSDINEAHGRKVGDGLLKEVAKRLNTVFRKTDGISRLTVSRFAGDEFAVLLNELTHEDQATWAIKRLLDIINLPAEIDGNKIHLSCRVGVSIYPTDADSVDKLLNNAMTAKEYGKKNNLELLYQFYDQHMQNMSIKHLRLHEELHIAIKNNNWQLFYQPKFDIKLGKVVGAEALIRWDHPERGILSPYEFIDFAEQHGLILPIGDWVINQSCLQLKSLIDLGFRDCKIAINLASVQLMQPDIVNDIFTSLDRYKVSPMLFEVEVTETNLIDNIEVATQSLQRLSARGITVAIDDFGTGYSSLSYLKSLPIDSLKIDRTFIKDLQNDDNDKQIVCTLIDMAHSMNMSVVAEGVEEQEQLNILKQLNCDQVQGYLIGKPLSAEDFIKVLKTPTEFVS